MKFDEMLASQKKVRRKPRDEEHRLQAACVKWFRLKYRNMASVLFAVPNGNKRTARNGAYMNEEGMLSGVADLILLKSNRFYGGLAIEMKTKKGRQEESQKAWQKECEANGNKYVICRSFDDFRREIDMYVKDMD